MIQPYPVAQLRRELGRWDLTAIGINQVIGGAVFAMPATLAALASGWSPILIAAVGFASMLIALTFAEVASRFDGTGGPDVAASKVPLADVALLFTGHIAASYRPSGCTRHGCRRHSCRC